MPWTSKDATKHTKSAKSPASKKQWAKTADAVLAQSGNEGKAIRIANAAVNKRKK
jgi:uncharacterized protein YdaT